MTLAGTLAIVACTDRRNPYESQENLSFNPVVNMLTKADSTTAYPSGGVFGLVGYTLPSGKTWAANSSEGSLVYDHVAVSNSGEYWQPSDPSLVKANQMISLVAYSPHDTDANVSCDMSNGVKISGFDLATNSNDIMFAGPVYDYNLSDSKGVIQLPFTRVLTEIDFFAFSDLSSGLSLNLKRLSLSGFRTKGDFAQLPTPAWTLNGEEQEIVIYDNASGISIQDTPEHTGQIGNAAMMIPQRFSSVLVAEYEYINSAGLAYKEAIDTLKYVTNWVIGSKCVYVLQFDEKEAVKYSNLSENL